jgi:hypothetical protein
MPLPPIRVNRIERPICEEITGIARPTISSGKFSSILASHQATFGSSGKTRSRANSAAYAMAA